MGVEGGEWGGEGDSMVFPFGLKKCLNFVVYFFYAYVPLV